MQGREETLTERETIVRWDETTALAYLWTAARQTQRLWQQLGYASRTNQARGPWACRNISSDSNQGGVRSNPS